jgi:hypothetical protein
LGSSVPAHLLCRKEEGQVGWKLRGKRQKLEVSLGWELTSWYSDIYQMRVCKLDIHI